MKPEYGMGCIALEGKPVFVVNCAYLSLLKIDRYCFIPGDRKASEYSVLDVGPYKILDPVSGNLFEELLY